MWKLFLLQDFRHDSIAVLICGGLSDDGMSGSSSTAFYDICIDDHVPAKHLLRGIECHLELDSVREHLNPFYSGIGRPSVDPDDADAD